MTRHLFRDVFDIDRDEARGEIAFVGDSPNDVPMLRFFPTAVGVANVLQHRDRLDAKLAWITKQPGDEGFVEFVNVLLAGHNQID